MGKQKQGQSDGRQELSPRLLTLQMEEGATSQGRGLTLGAGKGKVWILSESLSHTLILASGGHVGLLTHRTVR